jgi:hypothetical protein
MHLSQRARSLPKYSVGKLNNLMSADTNTLQFFMVRHTTATPLSHHCNTTVTPLQHHCHTTVTPLSHHCHTTVTPLYACLV